MINPQLNAFLNVWDAGWSVLPASAGPKDRRLLFEYIAERMRLPVPDDIASLVRFAESEGRNVLLRIEHHEAGGVQPCLIYMHGGAWMQGSPMTHMDITGRIASANRQTVISVDYALAPEYPFPKAVHEVMDVVRWVHENAVGLGIDPAKIAIGGDSAGANLAAAACIGLRGSDYLPMAQLLIYPSLDFDMSRPSYTENADAPLLKISGMPNVNAMYCPNEADRENPLAAPLKAESHEGLPQTFVAVAQYDPLRDDGRAYANKLRDAGVAVEFDSGEGLIHGYLRSMEYCDDARAKLQRMAEWLSGCFSKA